MIDWDRVAELRDEVGEEDFEEVVDMFLEEVTAEMDLLPKDTDPDALEARLHFLKGSALNLGFEAFAKLCQIGEKLANSGDVATINLVEIQSCYKASRKEFEETICRVAAA